MSSKLVSGSSLNLACQPVILNPSKTFSSEWVSVWERQGQETSKDGEDKITTLASFLSPCLVFAKL